jgi:hypothetical protein
MIGDSTFSYLGLQKPFATPAPKEMFFGTRQLFDLARGSILNIFLIIFRFATCPEKNELT